MATFQELSHNNYYIIQENENGSLDLVFVAMVTQKCLLLEFQDDEQTTVWRKLSDGLHEVVEQLTLEQAIEFESYKAASAMVEADDSDPWSEEEEDSEDLWDEEEDGLDFLSKN